MKEYTVIMRMNSGRARYISVTECGKEEARNAALLIANWNGKVIRVV